MTVNELNRDYILNHLTAATLYEQLAEECCELAQAALKISRNLRNENPTSTSLQESVDNLVEEFSDVNNVAFILNIKSNPTIQKEKLERWVNRINNNL